MVLCQNCNKNAMFYIGEPPDQQIPLCLDCYIRWKDSEIRMMEMNQREINFLTEEMESITGLPGLLPRYPIGRTVIHTGGISLKNIHVSGSEIGVLNTGTIGNVDSTVTVLKTEGDSELAGAIAGLSEAVIKAGQLSTDQKNQVMELLNALSEEALVPKEKRKLSVVRALLSDLSKVLGNIVNIAELWQKTYLIFKGVFGI